MRRYKKYRNNPRLVNELLFPVAALALIYAVAKYKTVTMLPFRKLIFIAGIIILVVVSIKVIYKYLAVYIKRTKYLKSSISKIDAMSGVQFEEFLKVHFEKKGYTVSLTPKTGDYGVDLICKKKMNNRGIPAWDKRVIQAKRYSGKIGISAVQQIIGGMNYYDCGVGMVITNNYFTKNAWQLAQKSNVILWDRKKLMSEFKI